MSDRKLLELAAKAAGIGGRYASLDEFPDWMVAHDGEGVYYTASQAWNPLTDDGDALWLAVKLGLTIVVESDMVFCRNQRSDKAFREQGKDLYAATRRAIVRAAAEIGKAMEDQ